MFSIFLLLHTCPIVNNYFNDAGVAKSGVSSSGGLRFKAALRSWTHLFHDLPPTCFQTRWALSMAGTGVLQNGAKLWMQQCVFTNADSVPLLCNMFHKNGGLVQVREKEKPTCVPSQVRLRQCVPAIV